MKITLLGYGIEAESAYKYYKKLYPAAEFVAYDDKPEPKNDLPEDVTFSGGHHDFHNIRADIVVRTPAIAPSRVSSSGTMTSVTKEFFATCPAPIIGVTGTKGKGTTCSLIAEILKAAGKTVWLVGNIGAPALDVISQIKPGDIVVYELSSFQLWDLEQSPHVAVVLSISPDHLDVHKDVDDYRQAKSNITRWQKKDDVAIYISSVDGFEKQIAQLSPGKKIPYLYMTGAYVADGYFWIKEQKLCSVDCLQLLGWHNLENACAAITAAWQYMHDPVAVGKGLHAFKGLPHRIEFVREVAGVKYYDDSYSSAPPATIVAIKSFEQPIVLIVGGLDRGLDYGELGCKISQQKNIKKVLLIGQTKQKIADKLKPGSYELIDSLNDAIELAQKTAIKDDVVLLSPGCPSFDMFKNFAERGMEFQRIVGEFDE